MTKRPWHEQLASTALFPWWVNLALGLHAVGRAGARAVRLASGDGAIGVGDLAWVGLGLVAGAGWLVIAYAKRRHRRAPNQA